MVDFKLYIYMLRCRWLKCIVFCSTSCKKLMYEWCKKLYKKKVSQRHWTIEKLAIWMRQTSWNVSGFLCGEEIATTTCTNVWETFAAKAAESKTSATQKKKRTAVFSNMMAFVPQKPLKSHRDSFFHTFPWLLTHPQNIDICEKPLSLWRNLGTSLNRNISMCWNTRPLRGALT